MSILTVTAVWIVFLSFSHLHVLGQEVHECKYREKADTFNPFSPSMTNIQNLDSRFTISRFPCGYKLAHYQCGRVRAVVTLENSLDKNGLTYMSDVTVTLTTVKKGNASHQILKLSTKKLKRYIAQGNFSKSPWRWSYDAVRPKGRHRVSGSYNQTTRTADVTSGGVEVTFSTARTLIARCSDSIFKVYEGFNEGVYCGYPNNTWTDVNRMYNALTNQIPSDYHHRGEFQNDYISLVKQKEYHTTPLCKEATSILESGQCENLPDKVYECSELYRKPFPRRVTGYGECIRNNSIDPFKVYVACLRALCKTAGCDSSDTCNTLRNVALTCSHVQPYHTNMTSILARTHCQPLPATTTTTTAATTASSASDTVSDLKVGAACNETSQCRINMQCSGDPSHCTCKPGYTSHYGHCDLKLDEACNDTSDCGVNTECTGSPPQCTCLPGCIIDKGRCGIPVGGDCSTRNGNTYRQCVRYAQCRYGKCQCTTAGYAAAGQICVNRAECKYSMKEGLTPFPANGEQSRLSSNAAYPCRYKMANIQCGSAQTVITVDNELEQGYFFGNGYMANVTVNTTTVDSMGVATSQINFLDMDKLLEMQATGDYNMTIWDWSFSGPEEPDQESRITGHYDKSRWTAYLVAGQLEVTLTNGGTVLTIACTDPDYSALEEWPLTMCGGPNNHKIDEINLEEYFHKTTDRHHWGRNNNYDGRYVFYLTDVIALIKPTTPQSNPLCREASSITTSACHDMGEKLYRITETLSSFRDCMKRAKLDKFDLYVASLRTLCGVQGTTPELDVCHVFREVAGHCRVDSGHLHMVQLLNMAGCNATFSTTTTTTKAPRGGGWK